MNSPVQGMVPNPPAPSAQSDGLAILLGWEASVRRQPSVPELLYFVANETRDLIDYDQAFVVKRALTGQGWRIETASSVATVDRNAPTVRAIEQALEPALAVDARGPVIMTAPDDEALAEYPNRHWLWSGLTDRDEDVFGGLLYVRAHPFGPVERTRAERMADTVAHAWLALTANRPVRRLPRIGKRERRAIAVCALVVALLPVRLSALAPVEVVATRPAIVSAPFAGVVDAIDVAPNARVAKGQVLVRMNDVKLRNEFSLATEKLQVARARLGEVSAASFADAKEGRGISIADAEYRLADAEFRYARDLLSRTRMVAPRAGIAVFSDRREWEGHAVEVGQPIMEIADPNQVSYRIALPAREQLRLAPGSPVTVWLDSQPLWSQSATLIDASYKAREAEDGKLAFSLEARPADGAVPRLGSRGTARVRGQWAPLAYALLRRPIAGLRQMVGY